MWISENLSSFQGTSKSQGRRLLWNPWPISIWVWFEHMSPVFKKQFKTRTRSRAPVKTEHLTSYCRLALNEATDIPNRKGVVSLIVLTFSDQKQAFFHGGTTCCWLKEFFSLFSRYSPMKPPGRHNYNKHTCTLKSLSNRVHSVEDRFY